MSTELRFNYENVAKSIVAGIEVEDEGISDMIQNAFQESFQYSKSEEFQKLIAEKPDTVETQVDAYAMLMGYVCEKATEGIENAGIKEQYGPEMFQQVVDGLTSMVRSVYAILGGTKVVKIRAPEEIAEMLPENPTLLAAYGIEMATRDELDMADNDTVLKVTKSYLDKLQIPEEQQEASLQKLQELL